jgi:hypothetical protein
MLTTPSFGWPDGSTCGVGRHVFSRVCVGFCQSADTQTGWWIREWTGGLTIDVYDSRTSLRIKGLQDGGESGIRTLAPLLDSVSYRFHNARIAVDARDTVAPCPPLPAADEICHLAFAAVR